jgi:hypothetical protein
MRLLRAWFFFFLAGSIVCLVSYVNWERMQNTVPVRSSITLRSGCQYFSFTPDITNNYLVDMDFHSKLPREQMACLLNINLDEPERSPACNNVQPLLNIKWQLTENGRIVRRFSTNSEFGGASFTGDGFSRFLGGFSAESGGHYVLELDVLADESTLAKYQPQLVVQIIPAYTEVISWRIIECAIIVVFCILGGIYVLLFTRRRAHPG